MNIFVSVGTGLNEQQEAFVSTVEERLRAIGFVPNTLGGIPLVSMHHCKLSMN